MTDFAALITSSTVTQVNHEELNVDESYQRPLDHGLVNDIANKWNQAAADPILVSQRADGTKWIVNGQHRAAGSRQAGKTEIQARVVTGLDRASEAELRLAGNHARADSAQDKFKARVAAGHQESLNIISICNDFETTVNFKSNMSTGINAVSALEWLYQKDGNGTIMVRVFEVIQDAWGTVSGKHSGVAPLKAVWWFLEAHPDANMDRLRERLSKVGIDEIDRKARSHKAAQGGAAWVNYYRAMVEEYNTKLTEAGRLMWRTAR